MGAKLATRENRKAPVSVSGAFSSSHLLFSKPSCRNVNGTNITKNIQFQGAMDVVNVHVTED